MLLIIRKKTTIARLPRALVILIRDARIKSFNVARVFSSFLSHFRFFLLFIHFFCCKSFAGRIDKRCRSCVAAMPAFVYPRSGRETSRTGMYISANRFPSCDPSIVVSVCDVTLSQWKSINSWPRPNSRSHFPFHSHTRMNFTIGRRCHVWSIKYHNTKK